MNIRKLSINMSLFRSIALGCVLCFLAACKGAEYKQTEERLQQPINCATAQADLQTLQGEKARVSDEIAAGAGFILPISAIVGLIQGTEGVEGRVAIGEYNEAIDARIAAIRKECGIH